MQFSQILTNIR